MGYETRIYFCNEYSFPKEGLHHSHVVAMIDMSKMGYTNAIGDFRDCFDTETPFSIYMEGYNDELDCECMVDVIEDSYGERIKYASDKYRLLEIAKEIEAEDPHWKLFTQLRKLIETFVDDDNIYIVHYGY